MSDAEITIDSHLPADWAESTMRDELTRALTATPKMLSPKWLYDDVGSDLFDQITRLPEYYPTEAERSILIDQAAEIASVTGADTLIELGSGTSDKTRTLLDALHGAGQLQTFVPLDVSEATLLEAATTLEARYDGLDVHAVVGDFTRHLRHLPKGGTRLLAFLGSTLGNFYVEERRAFLGALADTLEPGEWFLLGVDLLKPLDRLIDAYFDSQGITEQFILNVLTVLNRQLDADFVAELFDYVPFWDPRQERLDLRLRASEEMIVKVRGLDIDVPFAAGEELRVEISTKFRPDALTAELADVGFEVTRFWTDAGPMDPSSPDPAGDFGLFLARRV